MEIDESPVHERRGNLAVKYFKYTNKIEGKKNSLTSDELLLLSRGDEEGI